MYLGRDDEPKRLRRPRAGLRRRLYRPRPGTEREEIKRPQRLGAQGDRAVDDVSYTSDGYFGQLTDAWFRSGLRAVTEIQQRIVKQGERGAISRHFHAKNDKDKIAAWRLDLNRILQIFNVRPIVSVRSLLTMHFQTELAINTNVTVSDTRNIVFDTRNTVSDTRHMVSDIHRTIVNGQGGSGGANRSVSDIGVLSVTGSPLTGRRLDSNKVSDLNRQ